MNSTNEKVTAKLEDFPALMWMEGHTGAAGIIFFAAWVGPVAVLFQNAMNVAAIIASCAILSAFFVLLYGSFSLSGRYEKRIRRATNDAATRAVLQRAARRWILILSMAYVFVCSVLIWFTGGVTSPFIPFYIMIFVLTIARISVARHGAYVLAYFLAAILIACALSRFWWMPIEPANMAKIGAGDFQNGMYAFFVCASLVVPTLSAYVFNRRDSEN